MESLKVFLDGFYYQMTNFGGKLEREKISVTYTENKLGKTLSIGSDKHKVQMTISFDEILKMINGDY